MFKREKRIWEREILVYLEKRALFSMILLDPSTVYINRPTNSHDRRYISIGLRLLRPIDRIYCFLFTVPVHLSTAPGVTLKGHFKGSPSDHGSVSRSWFTVPSVVIERSSRILDRPCTIHGSLIPCYTWPVRSSILRIYVWIQVPHVNSMRM